MAQWFTIRLGTMRLRVRSLPLLSGFTIRHCCELWRSLQTWLGSGSRIAVALAQAGSYSSDSTPSLGTSICCGCSPKKKRQRTKNSVLNECVFALALKEEP